MNFYVDVRPRDARAFREDEFYERHNTLSKSPARFFSIPPRDSRSSAKLLAIQNRFIKAYFLTPRDLFARARARETVHSRCIPLVNAGIQWEESLVSYSFTFAHGIWAHLRHVLFIEIKTTDNSLLRHRFFLIHVSELPLGRSIRNGTSIIISTYVSVARCAWYDHRI